jgi:uncharacterized protein
MKIGVLSDTHIPDRARELPVKLLDGFKDVDMVIHAGDLVDLAVYKALLGVCKDVRVVCGNMDPAQIKDMFPAQHLIKVGGFTVGVVHGWGPPGRIIETVKEAFKLQKPDIIIFGHSHQAYSRQEGRTLFFNPGSPTDNVFAPFKSFGLIDITDTIQARIVKL